MSDDESSIEYLTAEDLIEIAAGVLPQVSSRDPGLLVSAAARPQTGLFGHEAYPTFAEKAAALLHSLARNHSVVDGNERLAWSATRVFCLLNGRDLSFTVDEAEELVLAAAAGTLELHELAATVARHLRR